LRFATPSLVSGQLNETLPRNGVAMLSSVLKDGDTEAFKEILSAYLDTTNKETFSKHAGIPRRTLFRMLSPPGNPTLEHLAKLVKALNHKKAA
jgi:DNA-binding phage protein